MSWPDDQTAPLSSSPANDRSTFLPVMLRGYHAGNVSKSTLLTRLLPLSLISLLGTLYIAARQFPGQYDWHTRVISQLISPRYNPSGFWIPSIGIAVAALLALPFAGYVEQRLEGISPRVSRWSGVALGLGILLVISVTLPLNVPSMPRAIRSLHEGLARTTGASIIGGMVLCCICGLKDRFAGQRSLHPLLVAHWTVVTLLPVVCGLLAGLLKLARMANLEWALELGVRLKHTMLWHLAFWEWAGITAFVLFMIVSVMLLPERVTARS